MTFIFHFLPFLAIVLLCFGCHSPEKTQKSEPQKLWEVHGSLTISKNQRYIQHNDGTPFLWLGGTAWGISEWLTRDEVDVYLQNRQEKGFNLIQMCLLWGKRQENPVHFPVNPENAYGKRALLYTNSIPDPARPDTVAGGSPLSPNDYWDHVDYILESAAELNMYIGLLPVWGRRYVNASHTHHSHSLFNEENAYAYGKFLGQRYRNTPNIIWVLGGDVGALVGNDFRSIYRAMAEGIIMGITGEQVRWNQPHPAWDVALMTYHPDGRPFYNSSNWFHSDAWLDFNMIETHIHRNDLYKAILNDYRLANPVKPTVLGEGHYEGLTNKHFAGPIHIRRQAYQTFFAGGAGHTYGAFLDSLSHGPLFSPANGWKNLLDLEGAQSFVYLKQFLTENQWWQWQPDTTLITGNHGKGELKKVAVTSKVDKMVLVYFPENTPCTLALPAVLDADNVNIMWFNPKNGDKTQIVNVSLEEIDILKPPLNWEDAVLQIWK